MNDYPKTLRVMLRGVLAALMLGAACGAGATDGPKVADVLKSEEERAAAAPAATEAAAAPENVDDKAPEALRKTDEFGRANPQSMIERFLAVVLEDDYETAAEYLDLRKLPKGLSAAQGPRYAEQLGVVLDRALWVDTDDLSEDDKGFADDGLPPYRDLLGTVEVEGESIDILLQRVPGPHGQSIWKFSNKTVARVPELHAVYGYGKVGEWLAEHTPDVEFLALYTWQWIMLAALFIATYTAGYVLTWPLFLALARSKSSKANRIAERLAGPTRVLIMIIATQHFFELVRPSLKARAIAEANTLVILAALWMLMRLIDVIGGHMQDTLAAEGRPEAGVLLRPAATAIKVTAVVVAALIWVENLGFKATTLIAGLGISGLAVALAAQKSIENLIGAITLYVSAPIRVGDYCRFGDEIGTVEEINLRATRIRTLNRTVIAVPNAKLADMELENYAAREKLRYSPEVILHHETTMAQMQAVLDGIRRVLDSHERVYESPCSVRFERFAERGPAIRTHAYVITTDYEDYLGVAEELNLGVLKAIADAGTRLAAPLDLSDTA